jgi:hypothetical protein
LVQPASGGSFAVSGNGARHTDDVYWRRLEFNQFSFATLSSVAFDDVNPVGRVAHTLSWMEAHFSLFDMAVIVGLLNSLKIGLVELRRLPPARRCRRPKRATAIAKSRRIQQNSVSPLRLAS